MGAEQQFLGSWKLVSFEFRREDGKVDYPLGKNVGGQLIYDGGGHMSAQIMKVDRPKFLSKDHLKGTLEEIRDAFNGYIDYYGTYQVNEEGHVITHKVEGSLVPNWVGLTLRRFYELSGDRLVLSTPPMPMGGARGTGVFTWERARQPGLPG